MDESSLLLLCYWTSCLMWDYFTHLYKIRLKAAIKFTNSNGKSFSKCTAASLRTIFDLCPWIKVHWRRAIVPFSFCYWLISMMSKESKSNTIPKRFNSPSGRTQWISSSRAALDLALVPTAVPASTILWRSSNTVVCFTWSATLVCFLVDIHRLGPLTCN